MARFSKLSDFSHRQLPSTGVLLTNLGSPSAPTAKAVRRYLKQFLWDRRVVEVPRPLWWLILNTVVLNTRPKRSAKAYQAIWTDDGSPLLSLSRAQAAALQQELDACPGGPIRVELAMRYGEPSIASALDKLREQGAQRLLVLPLYPQYSGSTTGSTFDAVSAVLQQWRWLPALRMVTGYHDDDAYIDALAASVNDAWQRQAPGQHLLMSFHGLPRYFLDQGDPYHCQCHKTARLLADRLGLPEDRWTISFQSRFGRAEWLQPYTDKTLEKLAGNGVGRIDVICPGFPTDCLETLEEMAIANRQTFLAAGGREYRYIPALNQAPAHIEMLRRLVLQNLQGWPEADPDYDLDRQRRRAEESHRRAVTLGADR